MLNGRTSEWVFTRGDTGSKNSIVCVERMCGPTCTSRTELKIGPSLVLFAAFDLQSASKKLPKSISTKLVNKLQSFLINLQSTRRNRYNYNLYQSWNKLSNRLTYLWMSNWQSTWGGGHRFLKTVDSKTFWGLGLQIYNKFTK